MSEAVAKYVAGLHIESGYDKILSCKKKRTFLMTFGYWRWNTKYALNTMKSACWKLGAWHKTTCSIKIKYWIVSSPTKAAMNGELCGVPLLTCSGVSVIYMYRVTYMEWSKRGRIWRMYRRIHYIM